MNFYYPPSGHETAKLIEDIIRAEDEYVKKTNRSPNALLVSRDVDVPFLSIAGMRVFKVDQDDVFTCGELL